MVNSLLNAVTTQLGTKFGDGYYYYVENVEQKLMKPCFTVDALMPTMRSRSPKLYDRTVPIVIHYFSDSKNGLKNDCYEMAERLLEYLEYIPYEKTMLRGEDISWQITGDVLQVFVTYRFMTGMSAVTEDTMEEILDTVTKTQ